MAIRLNPALCVALALLGAGCGDAGSAPPVDLAAVAAGDLGSGFVGCDRDEDGGPCVSRDAGPDMSCAREDRCAGQCTDRQRDPLNCGGCGNICALGELCSAGKCAPIPCPDCKCAGTIGLPGLPLSGWSNAVALSAADFDGDGRLDLAAANYFDAGLLLSRKNGTFKGGPTTGTDPGPSDVVAADLNGDGKQDMAVVNGASNSVTVVWGSGMGGFAGRVNLATELGPTTATSGDFDGDGKADLAVSDSRANLVSVYLQRPGNQFSPHATFPTGGAPVAIAAADFDGDGKLDLVTADAGDNEIAVLRGNGDGTFKAAVKSAAGRRPTWIIASDVDGDGKADVVVANPDDKAATLLRNAGVNDGRFTAPVVLAFAPGVDRVAAVDLDGDGKREVVVASARANRAGIFANKGNGMFGAAVSVLSGQAPSAIAVGDFNGDGKTDVAFANTGYGAVTTLLGDGKGGLAAPTAGPLPEAVNAAATGDLNGDGVPDVVVVANGGLSVVMGGPGGSLGAATAYAAGSRPIAIALGDFTGDKKLDVAVVNDDGNAMQGTVTTLQNDGTGKLINLNNEHLCPHPARIVAADFNGDSQGDFAVSCPDTGGVQLLINQSKGFRQGAATANCPGAAGMATGDLDGDGKLDLAVACGVGQGTALLLGKGDGTFTTPAKPTYTGTRPVDVTLADFDGDKHLDLLTRSNDGQPSLNVTFSDGKGGFGLPVMVGDDPNPYNSFTTGDLDGDGHPDIAAVHAYYPSSVILFLARTGVPFVPGGQFMYGNGGAAQLVTADFDGDKALDIVAAGSTTAQVTLMLQRCLP